MSACLFVFVWREGVRGEERVKWERMGGGRRRRRRWAEWEKERQDKKGRDEEQVRCKQNYHNLF